MVAFQRYVSLPIKPIITAACKDPECVRCQSYGYVFNQKAVGAKLDRFRQRNPSLCTNSNRVWAKLQCRIPQSKELLLHFDFLLPHKPVWNVQELFPGKLMELQLDRQKLLNECYVLYASNQFTPNSTPNGLWLKCAFLNQGLLDPAACKLAPNIVAALSLLIPMNLPASCFINAFLSVLFPGSVIEPHYGVTNARIRSHFTLQVPQSCNGSELYLEVNGTKLFWQEGQWLCFDDSFLHSAVYLAKHSFHAREVSAQVTTGCRPDLSLSLQHARIVLVVDVYHPGLSIEEVTTLNHAFGLSPCRHS